MVDGLYKVHERTGAWNDKIPCLRARRLGVFDIAEPSRRMQKAVVLLGRRAETFFSANFIISLVLSVIIAVTECDVSRVGRHK